MGTWSGRLILINTAIFIFTCLHSQSLFLPETDTLLLIGAKDPVSLAEGEWWRLVTPIFIHIGVIHFAVNNLMLYVIGNQLERILGGRWFVAIYLISGIYGNIGSALFSVQLSAGASGAIFGLLGCGFYLERSIGRKIMEATGQRPRNRVYAMTVLMNLAFGFLVPFIDNAAHIGGLVTGLALTFAMVNLRPNRLRIPRRRLGITIITILAVGGMVGTYFATSPAYLKHQLVKAADDVDHQGDKIYLLTQALTIAPDDPRLRLKRGRLLMYAGEITYALYDLREVAVHVSYGEELELLANELEDAGLVSEAWQLRRLLVHSRD